MFLIEEQKEGTANRATRAWSARWIGRRTANLRCGAAVDEIERVQLLRPAVLEDLNFIQTQIANESAAAIGDNRIDFDDCRLRLDDGLRL